MNSATGEAAIPPQTISQVVPEATQTTGQNELFKKLAGAKIAQNALDYLFSSIAKKYDGDFSSRIKSAQTTVAKIALKRLQGRDYRIQDVNDPYGGRIVVKNKSDIHKVLDTLDTLNDTGIIKIKKRQEVTKDTYHAHHVDFATPTGQQGELQVMLPQEEAESLANHGLRAIYGEKPPEQVKKLRNAQAERIGDMKNGTAQNISQQIKQAQGQAGASPVDPRQVAQILSNMQK